MERKSCCSGSRCVSTTPRMATPAKMPKKEDVMPVQPAIKNGDVKPVHQDVKKEAAVEATATAAAVKDVKSEAKETVATAVKKAEEPVKVNAGCSGGIGGGGCA